MFHLREVQQADTNASSEQWQDLARQIAEHGSVQALVNRICGPQAKSLARPASSQRNDALRDGTPAHQAQHAGILRAPEPQARAPVAWSTSAPGSPPWAVEALHSGSGAPSPEAPESDPQGPPPGSESDSARRRLAALRAGAGAARWGGARPCTDA